MQSPKRRSSFCLNIFRANKVIQITPRSMASNVPRSCIIPVWSVYQVTLIYTNGHIGGTWYFIFSILSTSLVRWFLLIKLLSLSNINDRGAYWFHQFINTSSHLLLHNILFPCNNKIFCECPYWCIIDYISTENYATYSNMLQFRNICKSPWNSGGKASKNYCK